MSGVIERLASKKLREIQSRESGVRRSIYENFDLLSPKLERPYHLAPIVNELERAVVEEVQVVTACPSQVGKSETMKHALITWSQNYPGKRHAYSTHSINRAREIMKEVSSLAFEAGLDPHTADNILSLSGGTRIKFGGCVAGSLTGFPLDGVHICDDLLKDLKEARSATIKNDRWNWFNSVAETRRHPGSSVVLNATRWAEDDPSGRAIKEYSYKYIRIPAICDSLDDPLGRDIGEPLWPKKRSLEFWLKFKKNAYIWNAMYQGNPRSEGDVLFSASPKYYKAFPSIGYYIPLYGLDLAYSKTNRSDHSVCLKGRIYDVDGELFVYITNLIRKQVQSPEFLATVLAEYQKEPGVMIWRGSGVEKGTASFYKEKIPEFVFLNANTDKYTWASPIADSFWNEGKILIPEDISWLKVLVEEIIGFTGQGDAHDDIVDALCNLCHGVKRGLGKSINIGGLQRDIQPNHDTLWSPTGSADPDWDD